MVRGALDRGARCGAARAPRAAVGTARGGRARAAGLGRHVQTRGAWCSGAARRRGGVSRADRRRRDLPGEPVPAARLPLRGEPGRPLRTRHARARPPSRRVRRRPLGGRLQPLARALPAPPRPRGAERADQGDRPARRRGPAAAHPVGQGPGRERDDRRPHAQRPRARMRVRLGPRARADGPAPRPRGMASRVERHRHAEAGGGRRRAPAGNVPARVGHGRAQDPDDARDRRARGEWARGVHGGDRLREPHRRAGAERGHQDARGQRRPHLARRGRRHHVRVRSAGRARGVLPQGEAGDRGGRRAPCGHARPARAGDRRPAAGPRARRRRGPARPGARRVLDDARARRPGRRSRRPPGPAAPQRPNALRARPAARAREPGAGGRRARTVAAPARACACRTPAGSA